MTNTSINRAYWTNIGVAAGGCGGLVAALIASQNSSNPIIAGASLLVALVSLGALALGGRRAVALAPKLN